ncbi:MAG: HAMP domain-containing histidine kinase [Moorea sp. SIOASIH]|nr:HAMP domain-containing histidine kinase [Moorena sp. SIOASIH]
MKFPSRLLEKFLNNSYLKLDLRSLRVRLTLGIAAVSALGMGSLAIWTSWKMQHILVSTHKQSISYIAERFPQDVEIYSDMVTPETGMQKAIDKLSNSNTLLWVKHPNNGIVAQSEALEVMDTLTSPEYLSRIPPMPEILEVNGSYWVVCGTTLEVKQTNLGKFYIAQDITSDQKMFLQLIRSLGIATVLAIGGMCIAIAFYIRRSLQPLQMMSQLTESISADDLGDVQIQLDNAPTEVRELAQTFDQMLVRLNEALENQRQFVSNVSHELRTPLTLVSGYVQSTLRRGANLSPPQREALEIASSEADRTVQMLQDLLDLARADSGHIHFNLESFVLDELVEEVAEMARQYTKRVIKVECIKPGIWVKADINRLKQVLLNLIDNAVKYSSVDKPVTVKLSQVDGRGRIEVCDRGIGIPLKQQARIFDRFYRVDETRTRSTGGAGLGLSIVKTLVEGMGGSVKVRSQLNKGSIFTVCLPLKY